MSFSLIYPVPDICLDGKEKQKGKVKVKVLHWKSKMEKWSLVSHSSIVKHSVNFYFI